MNTIEPLHSPKQKLSTPRGQGLPGSHGQVSLLIDAIITSSVCIHCMQKNTSKNTCKPSIMLQSERQPADPEKE